MDIDEPALFPCQEDDVEMLDRVLGRLHHLTSSELAQRAG